jgi:hypothetical protein
MSISNAANAQAERAPAFITGNALYADCMAGSITVGQSWCLGYITAIADVMTVPDENVLGFEACFPRVSTAQVRDVAKQFLVAHPERRHLGAAGLVARALHEAFPCR